MENQKIEELSPFPIDNFENDLTLKQIQEKLYKTYKENLKTQIEKEDAIQIGSNDQNKLDKEGQSAKNEMNKKQENNLDSQNSSLISIQQESSLSNQQTNKVSAFQFTEAFQALSEFENRKENNNLNNIKDKSEEPTAKQITTAIKVIEVQFTPKKAKLIIKKLNERALNQNLSFDYYERFYSQETSDDLQSQKKSNEDQKISREDQSEIELVSIDQEGSPQFKRNKAKEEAVRKGKAQGSADRFQIMKQLQLLERKKKFTNPQRKQQQEERNRISAADLQLLQLSNDFIEKRPDNIKLFCIKPVFMTEEERQRYIEKRTVAKAFIRKGYGLSNLRKEIFQSKTFIRFDESRYKTVSYGIATETFRKLEQFLEEYCKSFAAIKIDKFDVRTVCPFLLNCRTHLPLHSITFIKLMQLLFNVDIEVAVINRKEAMELYQKVQNHYYNRDDYKVCRDHREPKQYRPMKQLKRQPKLDTSSYIQDQGWSFENQCELLQLYIQCKNISAVRDKYKEIYGSGTIFDDCKAIKSKLFKALRASIRKLKAAAADNSALSCYLSFLNNLNNDRIKRILISPSASQARAGLCTFYIQREVNIGEACNLIQAIEQSVAQIEQKRGDIDYFRNFET